MTTTIITTRQLWDTPLHSFVETQCEVYTSLTKAMTQQPARHFNYTERGQLVVRDMSSALIDGCPAVVEHLYRVLYHFLHGQYDDVLMQCEAAEMAYDTIDASLHAWLDSELDWLKELARYAQAAATPEGVTDEDVVWLFAASRRRGTSSMRAFNLLALCSPSSANERQLMIAMLAAMPRETN